MAEVRITTYAEISVNGKIIRIGDKSTPAVITLDSTSPDWHYSRLVLADNAEGTLLTLGSGEDMTAFKVAIIKPSVDMTIGWAGSTEANNATAMVEGGHFFILTNDDVMTYDAVLATRVDEGTTAVVITKIMAGNNSASTGYVECWAAY